MIKTIIISILWSLFSLLAMIEYAPFCKDLPIGDKMVVFTILLLCGPIIAANTAITEILNIILPEGWDDDGNNGFR